MIEPKLPKEILKEIHKRAAETSDSYSLDVNGDDVSKAVAQVEFTSGAYFGVPIGQRIGRDKLLEEICEWLRDVNNFGTGTEAKNWADEIEKKFGDKK